MAITSSIGITTSVGTGGRNIQRDVSTIQQRLNELMGVSRQHLVVDGKCGRKTNGMIADFQRSVLKFRQPDSRVDPRGRTITALNAPNSATVWKTASRSESRKRVIRLHFRSISFTDVPFQEQLNAAIAVYAQYNIDVQFRSGRSVLLSDVDQRKFRRVDTSCVAGKDEWQALQKHLNDVPKSDICVFFVKGLWDPKETAGQEAFLGCGAYRPGSPACAVASDAGKYDMAHEVGHVLGMAHDNTNGNLMHPTQAVYAKVPELHPNQVSALLKSRLCH